MSQAKVSIVIPCYNQAHFLKRAIDSCLMQTYKNIEVIVINDGSTDETEAIALQYKDKIIYHFQQNKGLSNARNTGLRLASGTLVKFLDSDDELYAECIELQANSIANCKHHISVIAYRLDFAETPSKSQTIYPKFNTLIEALLISNIGPPNIFLYHKKTLVEIGGFDETALTRGGHEDYHLLCKLALLGVEAVSMHNIGAVYYKYPDSMSTKTENMRKTRINVWSEYLSQLDIDALRPEQLIAILGATFNKFCEYERLPIQDKILEKVSVAWNRCLTNPLGMQAIEQFKDNISHIRCFLKNEQFLNWITAEVSAVSASVIDAPEFPHPQSLPSIESLDKFPFISAKTKKTNQIKSVLDRWELLQGRHIVIYAMGELGLLLSTLLKPIKDVKLTLLDSSASDRVKSEVGLPIYEPSWVKGKSFDVIIIASDAYYSEIKGALREDGVDTKIIWRFGERGLEI